MSEPTHDPGLTALERALAGLVPSSGALNRDALMFAAGRASVRRGWAWPCAAAGATAAALVLGALLLLRPAPEPVVRFVPVPAPPQPSETPTPPDAPSAVGEALAPAPKASPLPPETDYLTARHQVERWGDAGLPHAPIPAADERPAPAADPLDLPPDARADPWLQRRKAMLNPGGPL
jgi:hypothetical protein